MQYGPLVISINGYHVDPTAEEEQLLQHPLIGGVILYANNYQDKAQLLQLTSEIKTIAQNANKELIVMVDHEGGYVQRFRIGFSAVPAAKVLGDIYDINPDTALVYAYQLGVKVGQELREVGIDIILGPVLDLDNGNSVISGLDRAYHSDPNVVTIIAGAYIQGLEESGMHAVLKHFPGHGSVIGDSHVVEPIDNREFEVLKALDLLPFKNLIEIGNIGAVMPAHVTYTNVDNVNTAGASKIWLQDILREDLNFEGVIISDCLSMVGAGDQSNLDKMLQALEFGDLALMSHKTPNQYLDLLKNLDQQDFEWSEKSQGRVEHWLSSELNVLQPASSSVTPLLGSVDNFY